MKIYNSYFIFIINIVLITSIKLNEFLVSILSNPSIWKIWWHKNNIGYQKLNEDDPE